jgi:hypothetical protein
MFPLELRFPGQAHDVALRSTNGFVELAVRAALAETQLATRASPGPVKLLTAVPGLEVLQRVQGADFDFGTRRHGALLRPFDGLFHGFHIPH